MYFLFQERDDWVQAIEQQILSCLQSNESGREKVMHIMVGLRPCCPKVILAEVLSPEIFSQVTRNAELCQLNFYHAQQHPNIFLALVLSQRILKNDIKCVHSLLTLYDFWVT